MTEQDIDLSHDQLEVKLDEKKFEIPVKKRIQMLEPDPEEEINDSSEKPESGFIKKATFYPKEEIIDTSSKPKNVYLREE